ncbi:hypothetical protein Q2K19_22035 [Micromonospora soli]|uniref:hypothetical protein n=1 Tax=Micromonospora sp. NBRC 110009 TaxID=3061627 RepID=UPI0026732EF3|nr:hypothetical protein [Micromonospora sp. NBRC 110009]WKT96857.1 hypothetical protein Q2K19_22035 [Micromonospora sp. NBRC 110009]
MKPSDWIALLAAVIALSSLAVHMLLRRADKREAKHTSIITALQGDKAAVGYEAYRIGRDGWPPNPPERAQRREALCLAFIFERSDRTSAMVHSAMRRYPDAHHAELEKTLHHLYVIFEEAQELDVDFDLHRGWQRLAMLARMLKVPHIAEAATQRLSAWPSQRRAREDQASRSS